MTASTSAGTLDKILHPLRDACEERKRLIDAKFEEDCAWLRQELRKIRNMVDNKAAVDGEVVDETSVVRGKRKSSESQPQAAPTKKKPSLTKEELDDELNQVPLDQLPDVLAGMKVVELKEALRARGETVQSRALKKDLIQQLQAAITAHHQELERRRKARSRSRGGKVEVVDLQEESEQPAVEDEEQQQQEEESVADDAADIVDDDDSEIPLTQETVVSGSQATEVPTQTSDIADSEEQASQAAAEVVEMAVVPPERRASRRISQLSQASQAAQAAKLGQTTATTASVTSASAASVQSTKPSSTFPSKPKSAEDMETQIKQRMQERLSTHSRRQSQKEASIAKTAPAQEPSEPADDDAGMDISTTPIKPERSEEDDSLHQQQESLAEIKSQAHTTTAGGPSASPMRLGLPKFNKTASTGSSTSSGTTDAKRPLNLVSGLHSLTSLVKKTEPAQDAATNKSALPSKKLAALRQAEEAKRLQEQKEEERRKRKEQMEQRRVQKLQTGGPISASQPTTDPAPVRTVPAPTSTLPAQSIKPTFANKIVRPVRPEQPPAVAPVTTATASAPVQAPAPTAPTSAAPLQQPTAAAAVLPKPAPAEVTRPVLAEIKPVPSPHTLPLPTKLSPAQPAIPVKMAVSQPVSEVSQAAGMVSASAEEPADSYDISDRGESDSENESDDENRPGKPIPAWARGPQLREALEKQFGPNRLDPDTIFPEVHTCDLEDIFDMRKKRYVRRTSSANWTLDQLTIVEKRNYRTQMGF